MNPYPFSAVTVFDIDGTLADDRHRRWLITQREPRLWDRYYAEAVYDQPIEPMHFLFSCIVDAGQSIVFSTGRPEAQRENTKAWLRQHLPVSDPLVLLMRGNNDRRSNGDLKSGHVRQLRDEYDMLISAWFDDNPNTVKTLRGLGINTIMVSPFNEKFKEV